MKNDQDILYEAIRDAWLIRLREINFDVTNGLDRVHKDMQQVMDLLAWLKTQLLKFKEVELEEFNQDIT